MALFNDAVPGRRHTVKAGYGTAKKARQTIRALRGKPPGVQKRVAQTMYFRAKYHANQTPGMREAMKIYGEFLGR